MRTAAETATRAALLLVAFATAASVVNGALLPPAKVETPKYSVGTALRYLSKAIYKDALLNKGKCRTTNINLGLEWHFSVLVPQLTLPTSQQFTLKSPT